MLAPAANRDAVPRLSPRKREQVREQAITWGKDSILCLKARVRMGEQRGGCPVQSGPWLLQPQPGLLRGQACRVCIYRGRLDIHA